MDLKRIFNFREKEKGNEEFLENSDVYIGEDGKKYKVITMFSIICSLLLIKKDRRVTVLEITTALSMINDYNSKHYDKDYWDLYYVSDIDADGRILNTVADARVKAILGGDIGDKYIYNFSEWYIRKNLSLSSNVFGESVKSILNNCSLDPIAERDIFGDNFSLYLERIKSIFPNGDVMVATQYDFNNSKVMKKRFNSF